MTADEFRKLALALPTVVESAHMNHPDFRVNGRIFATLGAPDLNWAMVKLPPEEQGKFLEQAPTTFRPCSGAWGRAGSTNIYLANATKMRVRPALQSAWEHAVKQGPGRTKAKNKKP